jgi:hypothetical protein
MAGRACAAVLDIPFLDLDLRREFEAAVKIRALCRGLNASGLTTNPCCPVQTRA